MHVPAALTRAAERRDERLVLEEAAVRDRSVDALEVLIEHPTGADRQMPDLRVAHLSGRQADRLAGRLEPSMGVLRPEPVEHGRARQLDRVPRSRRSAAPAVEDDEDYERIRAADRQIAVKLSMSREAPPTSAPSTAGCASSSFALSGLTEPP